MHDRAWDVLCHTMVLIIADLSESLHVNHIFETIRRSQNQKKSKRRMSFPRRTYEHTVGTAPSTLRKAVKLPRGKIRAA